MPGIAFLNKKEFHTGSFRMIEKVWQAEKAKEASERLQREHAKRLEEERYEEQLKQHQVRAGLLPAAALERMEWMYNHQSVSAARNLTEDYLLGRPVDAQALGGRGAEAKESFVTAAGEDFARRVDDPLLRMRAGQRARRGDGMLVKAANRPRRFDESDEESAPFPPLQRKVEKDGGRSRQALTEYVQRHLGGAVRVRHVARPGAAGLVGQRRVPCPTPLTPVDCAVLPQNILREMGDSIVAAGKAR